MSSGPELIDIGICGTCAHGKAGLCLQAGVYCYQNGRNIEQPDMSVDLFKKIIDETKDTVYQVALGGRGDPNKHKAFAAICEYSRQNKVVPNYTTSGLNLTDKEIAISKEFCGAVAVSWYRHAHTFEAIRRFTEAGVKTNIHYVLGKNSIEEALTNLKQGFFPEEASNVIFLLHKPVGLGDDINVLKPSDPLVKEFFELVDERGSGFPYGIGFDSCSIPGIVNFNKKVDLRCVDTCEGARWSMYIDSLGVSYPCSFDVDQKRWAFPLEGRTVQDAWSSSQFEDFRNCLRTFCSDCVVRQHCMGGCPIVPGIVLCERRES